MKLREFIGKITGGAAVQEIVPCNQNLIYPQFSVFREQLCLHFIGHTTVVQADGLLIGVPEVYLQVSYPQGEILGYQNLKYSPAFAGMDFAHTTLLYNRAPEERARRKDAMARLEALGDAVLETWDLGEAAQRGNVPVAGDCSPDGTLLPNKEYPYYPGKPEREGRKAAAAEALAGSMAEYHKMLAEVLEPEQVAAYARLLRTE